MLIVLIDFCFLFSPPPPDYFVFVVFPPGVPGFAQSHASEQARGKLHVLGFPIWRAEGPWSAWMWSPLGSPLHLEIAMFPGGEVLTSHLVERFCFAECVRERERERGTCCECASWIQEVCHVGVWFVENTLFRGLLFLGSPKNRHTHVASKFKRAALRAKRA